MMTRLYPVTELLYGTGLLTIITAAPEIMMKYRINPPVLAPSIYVNFPSIGAYTFVALLLTALAMLPTLVTLSNFLTRLRCHFLVLLPWILVCLIRFLGNTYYHVLAINEMGRVYNSTYLSMALIIYCLIFGLATELVLHWIATCHLRTDGMPFLLRYKL